TITYKSLWLFATAVVCAAVEVLGYARQRRDDWEGFGHDDPRMLQSVATIIGPTPLLAAHCFIMANVVRRLGTSYSCLSPGLFCLFLCCDIFASAVQGVGSGIRASIDSGDAERGRKVMLRGVSLHIAVISFFALFSLEFFWRYASDRPHKSLQATQRAAPPKTLLTDRLILCLSLLGGSTMLLLVRAIERMSALADGEEGGMVRIEAWLNIFDAAIIIVALSLDDMLHPQRLWEEGQTSRDEEEKYLIDALL
ncbi:hypothetical protein K523DRAFT_394904, partial [Schizophyllum commune Tattone D]